MIEDKLASQIQIIKFIHEQNVKSMSDVYEKFPEIRSLMRNKNFRLAVKILLKENRRKRYRKK